MLKQISDLSHGLVSGRRSNERSHMLTMTERTPGVSPKTTVVPKTPRSRWLGAGVLLTLSLLGVSGCVRVWHIQKGSVIAQASYSPALSRRAIWACGVNLSEPATNQPLPVFFVVLPGGPTVRYDEISRAMAEQYLSVDTNVPAFVRERWPPDYVQFRGGGYIVGFVHEKQTGITAIWDPTQKVQPTLGVTHDGPFWSMPLTVEQFRALFGEPDKVEWDFAT